MNKKTILSGIQPTGVLTLGNYLGALKNWVTLQHEYDCNFFVADLHAITIRKDPEELRRNIKSTVMQYIACGLDPELNNIFLQSHVHEHAELAWILNCNTYMGELSRMTQFKDKSQKQENVGVGLFDYPVLMAADILLYDADYIPVGEDQRQHIEITRDIAKRFNSVYKEEIFKIPEPFITKQGAKIMSLQDPTKKMSKSDQNPNGYIALLDPRDVIIKKFKKAVTDSENVVKYRDEQPGIKNLINIYSIITGKSIEEIEKEFDGAGYGTFKVAVGEVVADTLDKIQEEYKKLDSKEYEPKLQEIYKRGAEVASKIAREKLNKVYDRVGFIGKI